MGKPLEIRYIKLSNSAVTPTRASIYAAAWDITATSKTHIDEGDYGYIEYGTDLAIEIPYGYAGLLYPRSSVSNTGLFLANSVGIIDPDYRGEIKFRYKWIPNTRMYEVGERVGQIRIEKTIGIRWVLVDELTNTDRDTGGFGSTGK